MISVQSKEKKNLNADFQGIEKLPIHGICKTLPEMNLSLCQAKLYLVNIIQFDPFKLSISFFTHLETVPNITKISGIKGMKHTTEVI